MLNIAIEGKFLVGALTAAVVVSVTHNVLIGIAAAAFAASLVGLLLAWLGIRWKVDQFIAGIVINFGAVGITNFLFLRVLTKNTELNTPPSVEAVKRRTAISVPPHPGPARSCSTRRPTCTSR
jgi:simple sugar transport system permease protein